MKIFNYLLLAFLMTCTFSCVDQEFDAPPAQVQDPVDLPVPNMTIAEIKATHVAGQLEEITEDWIFRAIITADDQSGNLFKRIVVEDESGGIEISLNANSLFTFFPIGTEIFVKCQGLIMADFAGIISIGGTTFINNSGNPQLGGIEELLIPEFIVTGLRDQQIEPTVKTISSLGTADVSTLITLNNVQFADNELGRTFADAINLNTENITMEDCDGNEITVRTSGFANFAPEIIPAGSGSLTAIYSVFNQTKQLLIRDLSDFDFTATRCDGSGTGTDPDPDPQDLPEVNSTIAEIKAAHQTGSFSEITEDLVISGIITADDQSGNYFKSIVLQDETAGIVLNINVNDLYTDYPIGMELFVKANGLITGDFAGTISLGGSTFTNNSGNLQLGGIEQGQLNTFLVKGSRNQPLPVSTKSINELGEDDISTLVTIEDIQFASGELGGTYADSENLFSLNIEMEDCDGNDIILRSSGFADFADEVLDGGSGSITAVYGVFNDTKQLMIRNLNDIDFGSERCDGSGGGSGNDGEIILEENFEGQTQFDVLDLDGWTNVAEVGTDAEAWYFNNFQGDFYAEGTAWQSNDPENVFWLITPPINLDEEVVMNFISAQHHWEHEGLTVMISDDFDGDVEDASWQTVDCTLPMESNDWYEWVDSGDINLRDYFSSGNVHVGFRYSGNVNSETTTYQIHQVTLTQK